MKVGSKTYQHALKLYDERAIRASACDCLLVSSDKVNFLLDRYSNGITITLNSVVEKYGDPR